MPPDDFKPNPGWRALGKAIWFDPVEKRLLVRARVVLREGFLEHLLCLEQTKEHESILATEAPARMIHAGLLLIGAEVGHPVRFEPTFAPPAGTPIQIEVEWAGPDGVLVRRDARTWIKNEKTGQTLMHDWVFAGSQLFRDEETNRALYAADGGDLVTVANFMSAILDVPFASSADDTNHSFVANTEVLPPRNTRVTLILRAKGAGKPAGPPPREKNREGAETGRGAP